MRKFIVICVTFAAVCAVFQKQGQKFIKSMAYAQRDIDPNSSVRRLAAEQRVRSEKEEAQKRVATERMNADFGRRMTALGVLPLTVPPHKMAVYVFNDSAREIAFSLLRADGRPTGDPDMIVAPGGYENREISRGGVVYIWAKGTLRRWQLNMEGRFEGGNCYAGCVYTD